MPGDATQLANAIRSGTLSACEAMEASLAAAARHEALGSISLLDAEAGRRAASAFDALPATKHDQPFGGVPTLAKDLGGPFAGFPVIAGSRLLPRKADMADSELAQRFRSLGLCVFGLSTSPEFGLSLSSEPAIGPICRNPLDPRRIAGGSSGGAAAAVAAGIVSIAHATDAGGSIRVPAAACGLIGLKPGRGSMPGGPAFTNHLAGIASELAVCRSVRDAAAMFHGASGKAGGPFPPTTQKDLPGRPLRLGLLTQTGTIHPTAPERSAAVEEAGRSLEADGHRLVAISWAEIESLAAESRDIFFGIVAANLWSLCEGMALDPSKAEPLTQAVALKGQAMSATALLVCLDGVVRISHRLWQMFDDIDCLIAPMLSVAPPMLGSFPTDHRDVALHLHRMADFAPTATLANVGGCPALTLPFGRDAEGLPLPVQLIAPMGGETLLLSLAERLESEGRWAHPHPVAGLA